MERMTMAMTDAVIERPQTLIEKLEQLEQSLALDVMSTDSKFPYEYDAGKLNGAKEAIDIVKQHQAESGWVSVGERLPSDRGYFLVRLNTGEITVDYYDYDNDYWSKNYGNVTHFMQLPQPPSEVQDD